MYRVDNPSSVAAPAAHTAPGTPDQYYTDPVGPVPGTIVDAEHVNTIQEELCGLVLNAGIALVKATDTQLVDAIGGAAAIMSDVADTGVVTNHHTCAVIAATASRSDGPQSAVCGGDQNRASGQYSGTLGGAVNVASGDASAICGGTNNAASAAGAAILGADSSTASAANATIAGGTGNVSSGASNHVAGSDLSIASGVRSVIVGSRNVELKTGQTVAGGYDAGAAIGETDANQNLSWKIEGNGGNAHVLGSVYAGGDVDHATVGNSATCRMDGATGEVTATGGLRITDATNEAAETYTWVNAAGIAAGAWQAIVVANTSIAATSLIIWSFSTAGASQGLVQGGMVGIGVGTVTFNILNHGVAQENQNIDVHYTVINPA